MAKTTNGTNGNGKNGDRLPLDVLLTPRGLPTEVSKIERYGWNTEIGTMGEFRLIHKDNILVDPTYQRDADVAKAREIAANFDWRAFGAALVSKRRDGRYWAFDTQHRVLAAKMRSDIKDVPCIVFGEMTVADEARAFLKCNTARKNPQVVQKMPAMITGGDENARFVRDLAAKCGRVLGSSNTNGIGCVSLLMRLVAKDRERLARAVLLADEISRGSAIVDVLVDGLFYLDENAPGFAENPKWIARVKQIGARALIDGARDGVRFFKRGGYKRGGARVYALGMIPVLNRGQKHRLSIPGEPAAE